ncbi:MAG: hypothetical protein ACE15D_18555, partial [Candidatus Eisenbacteria bacterium]
MSNKRTPRMPITWVFLLAVVVALAGSQSWGQQPTPPDYKDTTALPEGQIGARIRNAIEVANSGSAERIRRFVSEECTEAFQATAAPDEHVAAWQSFLRDSGGVDFYSVRTYTPERAGQTVAIVKD